MIQDFRHDALTMFHGLPIFPFAYSDPAQLEPNGVPDDIEAWAWRVGADEYDGPGGDGVWAPFLDTVDTTSVRALTLGDWESEVSGEGWEQYRDALLAAADRFPNLEALFVADVPSEMTEVSWIEQADPGPLLAAFPGLVASPAIRSAASARATPSCKPRWNSSKRPPRKPARGWRQRSNRPIRFSVVDGEVTHAAGVIREQLVAREWYGGRRSEFDAFLQRFGAERWERVVALAERAAAHFPGIRALGVDLALDNESEYVFDVDPFGAYLPALADSLPNTVRELISVRAAVLRSLSAHS